MDRIKKCLACGH